MILCFARPHLTSLFVASSNANRAEAPPLQRVPSTRIQGGDGDKGGLPGDEEQIEEGPSDEEIQQPTTMEEEQRAGESHAASVRLDAKAEERNFEGADEGTVQTGRETGRGGRRGWKSKTKIDER